MSGMAVRGLRELIEDVRSFPREELDGAKKVVEESCKRIQADWRQRWNGYEHIPHLPHAITHDVTEEGMTVSGVVGPEHHRKQGPLARIIEYGTIHSAPIPGMLPAVDAEEPLFFKAVRDIKTRLMGM